VSRAAGESPGPAPANSPEAGGGLLARWSRRLFGSPAPGARAGSGCRDCGACCESFGGHLRASKTDLERWRAEGREDLLSRVNRLGWLWVDPVSARPLERCPHLERVDGETTRCRIHRTKPEMCRSYPTLAHGRRCVRGITVH